MKIIRLAFLVSLFCFLIVGAIVLALSEKEERKISSGGEKCIITIDEINYDVTEFRAEHEGGDVFSCGADMSKEFFKEHPRSFLKDIEKLIVKSN